MKLIRLICGKRSVILGLLFFIVIGALTQPMSSFASTRITATDIKLGYTLGTDSITLNWNKVTHEKGVKGYYVYRATTSGGQTILPETDFWIDGTSYADIKLVPDTFYYYIVKPVLRDGHTGKASNEIKVYYKGDSPTITLRASVKTGNITLDWSDSNSKDIIGYYVYKSTKSGKQTNTSETDFWITDTSYEDKKAIPGTTYYYIVRPVMKDRSIGSASNEVTIKSQQIYGTIAMTIGNKTMLVDGKYMDIDPGKATVPVIKDGRTMLPIRALIEAMGGTVDYDSGDKKVTVKWNQKTVCIWIGKKTFSVDGTQKDMDVIPYISDTGRTMLPLRFIIENLGCAIDWDGGSHTATITYILDSSGYYPPTPPDASTTSWEGIWFTERGKMILTQNGIYVNGTYGNGDTIKGIISGDKLIGTYIENRRKGNYEFVISKYGDTFDGKFTDRENPKKQWQNWDGKREIDTSNKYLRWLPSPVDFSGTWNLKGIGKIIVKQEKNTLNAASGSKERITGTVENNKFTGTYTKGNTTYIIEFYMLEGNNGIIGYYAASEEAKQNWKEFTGKSKYNDHYDDDDDN